MRELLVLLVLAGCSSLVEPADGTHLVCATLHDECPLQSEAVLDVEAFAARVPDFDARARLEVRWYDAGEVFWREGAYKIIAYTEDDEHVHVTSRAALLHELMHVRYWRSSGDPDDNHEAPPGPWSSADNDTIRAVELDRARADAAEQVRSGGAAR